MIPVWWYQCGGDTFVMIPVATPCDTSADTFEAIPVLRGTTPDDTIAADTFADDPSSYDTICDDTGCDDTSCDDTSCDDTMW